MTAEPPSARRPLDVALLRERLTGPGRPWASVDVVESTGSTNADLRRAASAGAPHGSVLLAEHQADGRGRLGRSWQAPPRTSLAVSVLLRPGGAAHQPWGWLPLLAGLAVAEAVAGATGLAARLKWPNDVLAPDGRKLAGVLAERVGGSGPPAVVVGVGLNVSQSADELPSAAAVSLTGAGADDVDRTLLAVALLEQLHARYLDWERGSGGPGSLHDAYVGGSATLGRTVRVLLPGGDEVSGVATGVDPEGRLLVTDAAGAHAVAAGDVVHLR